MMVKKSDLLALMPCPLKIPMEKEILNSIRKLNEYYETSLTYKIVSNAVAQEDVFLEVMQSKAIDELPEIMMAPGFSRFFFPDFVNKYRNTGCFSSVANQRISEDFRSLGMSDPEGCYDIIGFNPLVFLVDKTNFPDLTTPTKWSDLLKEDYSEKVAYRGHNDREFCEGILLNIYKEFGKEGIRKIGRTVKCRLHPAQMAKYAGTKMPQAPAVSIIPYSFACMARKSKNVTIVWPEDGAIVNPLVMLVKNECKQVMKDLAMELSATKMSSILRKEGFYSLYQDAGDRNMKGSFKWLGWDFLKNNDLQSLLQELNQVMFEEVHKHDNQIQYSEKGGCTCSS
jgi:putative spermidine/putrescine transport system substrate-binding protein